MECHAFLFNYDASPKVEFDDQNKKNIIQLEGGHNMVDLFRHVGKVQDEHT